MPATREEMIEKISTTYNDLSLSPRVEMRMTLGLPTPATESTPFVTVAAGLEEKTDAELTAFYNTFVEKGFIK